MRVALCQIPVSSRPEVNSGRVRDALAEAADGGADLAVFPEATQVRFGSDLRAAAEPLDGPFCSGLAAAAKQTGVALVAGVFEPAPGGRVHNTAVAYDGTGELVAAYRKLHLFDAFGHRESDEVAPGSAPVACTLAGVRAGLAICYDVRFGELSRALAVAGAELLVLPAAWAAGLFKEEHWVTLVRARAIENTMWVAAVCQVPDPDEPPTKAATGIGRSMLVDPLGVVRADLGPAPGVTVAEVDTGLVATVRASLPSLANRRDDVFGPPRRSLLPDRGLPEDGLLAGRGGGEADAGHRAAGHGEAGDGLDARPGQALAGGFGRPPGGAVSRRPHHHVLVARGAAVAAGGGEGAAGRDQGGDRGQAGRQRERGFGPAGPAIGRAGRERHRPARGGDRGAHGDHDAAGARHVLERGPGGADQHGQIGLAPGPAAVARGPGRRLVAVRAHRHEACPAGGDRVICRLPVPSSAPAVASPPRCQPVRVSDHQTAASVRAATTRPFCSRLTFWWPTMT